MGLDRFSIVDMNHVFHQMEMERESLNLFIFNTPFGLHKFKRLVQKISPAAAECYEALTRVYKGIPGLVQIKDYLVIHGKGKVNDQRLEVM